MKIDAATLRKAIVGKELMDEAFYVSRYGERIPPGEPALDHYVRVGHAAGHAPCEAFDPVLHEVLNGPAAPSEWPDRAQAESAIRPAADLFPDLNFQVYHWKAKPDDELAANVSELLEHPTRAVTLPTPVGEYSFANPPSDEVFAWIQAGRPFAFVRLPHGFWDCCNAVDRVDAGLATDARARSLSAARRRALAIRLMASREPRNGNFAGDYIDTILDDLRHHPREPDLLTGIAFKGAPTYEDSAFGLGPPRPNHLQRARKFTQYFSPHDRLYDAMVWKRWAILGGLKDFPAALRGRPLILVARDTLGVLAERLDLPRLVMVDVPPERTQLIRRQVLSRIEAAIQAGFDRHPDQTPVVLFQCGASISYWFIRRLRPKFPKAIYLDIGEALTIWCRDLVGTDIWMAAYGKQVRKACGLDRSVATP